MALLIFILDIYFMENGVEDNSSTGNFFTLPAVTVESHIRLEIRGKAQHEAAQRRKSNLGIVKGLKFRLQQSHVARTPLHFHIHV